MCVAIARPHQTLKNHLLGVAEKTKYFAAKVDLPQAGELIGLLHDLGKYSKEFQKYLNTVTGLHDPDEDEFEDAKAKKGKIDHSTAGAQWIWQKLKNYGNQGQGELCAQVLSLCIASHHSGLIDCLKPNGDNNFVNRMSKIDNKTHYNECCESADDEIIDKAKILTDKNLFLEMGQKINAILNKKNPVSQSTIIPDFHLGFLARFLFSCLIDADRIDSASVENPIYLAIQNRKIDWSVAINRFEKKLDGFPVERPIDYIRREISNDCYNKAKAAQDIYTLTVPTGGGKTLASLRYALHHAHEYNLDRIIYIIPYTSIIEQNAEAIQKMIEDEKDDFPWVLEHHSNIEPEKQTWHSKLASDNWESPIILTTMVQFLEALFGGGTRGVRRLHQLANSVLIFDEVQTLPIKCVHIFCNAINFLLEHGKTTVVLCTATQPLLNELRTPDKGQLFIPKENELVKDVRKLFNDLKRVEISNKYKVGGWSAGEIKELALYEFNSKGSCLVVVNTKSWAEKLYHLCQDEISEEAIFHLSTHQCSAHRKKILHEIRSRLADRLPVLCISTQLIEAGVDISFSSVIRFLAGLDSIAQAAGRCNRNGTLTDKTGNLIKGLVHVINPDDEMIESLIDIKAGRDKAERIFRESQGDDLLNPEMIKLYFQYYFFERASDMEYPLSSEEAERNDTLLNLLSVNSKNGNLWGCNGGKLPLLRQSFMKAGRAFKTIEAPVQTVIVPYGDGKGLITKLCAVAKEFNAMAYYDLLKKTQQYTVNVFPNEWRKLQKQRAVYEIQSESIYYLDERYYSEEFGLSMEPVGQMSDLMV